MGGGDEGESTMILPNLADMAKRIAELEAALRDVRAAIIEKAPDCLWVTLIETACDRIDGVLQQ